MTVTAEQQLQRLLALIPQLADEREHPIDEVARRVGFSRAELVADLAALTDRYDAPGGFVEAVQIYLDQTSLSVSSPLFRRPMRLTVQEMSALELGLALVRGERPESEQAAIERARERLRKAISKSPPGAAAERLRHADPGAAAGIEHLEAIRAALAARRKVRITYRAGGSTESTQRVIAPYAIANANQAWYVVACCDGGPGLRFFRADRIEQVETTTVPYEVPDEFQVKGVFHAPAAPMMTVRYSPRIARWVAEREDRELAADGSLTLEHPMADLHWAVRYVLQYGRDAEALGPPELREAIQRRLTTCLVP